MLSNLIVFTFCHITILRHCFQFPQSHKSTKSCSICVQIILYYFGVVIIFINYLHQPAVLNQNCLKFLNLLYTAQCIILVCWAEYNLESFLIFLEYLFCNETYFIGEY